MFDFQISIAKVSNGWVIILPEELDEEGNIISPNNARVHVFATSKEAMDYLAYVISEFEDEIKKEETKNEKQ